jgi:hypothetical protein
VQAGLCHDRQQKVLLGVSNVVSAKPVSIMKDLREQHAAGVARQRRAVREISRKRVSHDGLGGIDGESTLIRRKEKN